MSIQLNYQISFNHQPLLLPSRIDMIVGDGKSMREGNCIRSHSMRRVSEKILAPVPEKRKIISDDFQELSLRFKKGFSVQFRVYDDAVAYRLMRRFKDSLIIQNEVAAFQFAGHPSAYFPQVHKRSDADIFHTSYEELYFLQPLEQIQPKIKNYIVTVRKKTAEWYVGGMTDWTPRDITLNFNFLEEGAYRAEVCKDGVNADRYAADYSIETIEVNRKTLLTLHMAEGGGFVVRLSKK
ncbi:MAG: hypothetical protein NVS9B7_17390 [Flavisolibacter sp.]